MCVCLYCLGESTSVSIVVPTCASVCVHVFVCDVMCLPVRHQSIIREGAILHSNLGQILIGKLCVIGVKVELQPPTAPPHRSPCL